MEKDQAPKKHYGYAMMPRIIRKKYKDLTKLQKLLYIYLRDLCGENGVCYRSLRTLADETDFSIGYLSENIPLLEKAGLITAEKKKRNNKKWEVWHITIVDIWEENAKFMQQEKCSPDEQIEDEPTENCSQDEQKPPQSVHTMNENAQKCSHGANKEEKSLNNNPYLNKKESAPDRLAQMTSQEKQTYNNYCLCFKKDMPNTPLPNVTEKFVKDIVALASFIATQEEMQSLFDYAKARIYGNNPRVYPANLLNWRDAWVQEHAQLPWSPPPDEPQEIIEVQQSVNRENELLPVYLCKWMVQTGEEFGETGQEWINELEWYYQHTTCAEKEFYLQLLEAYQEALGYQESQRMDGLFIEFRQLLAKSSTERIAV